MEKTIIIASRDLSSQNRNDSEREKREPMKLRKFRGYKELVEDPYGLRL